MMTTDASWLFDKLITLSHLSLNTHRASEQSQNLVNLYEEFSNDEKVIRNTMDTRRVDSMSKFNTGG